MLTKSQYAQSIYATAALKAKIIKAGNCANKTDIDKLNDLQKEQADFEAKAEAKASKVLNKFIGF